MASNINLTTSVSSKENSTINGLTIKKSKNSIVSSLSYTSTNTNFSEFSEFPMPLYSLSSVKNEKKSLSKESFSTYFKNSNSTSNSLSPPPPVYDLPMPLFSIITIFKAIYKLTKSKSTEY
ncbi:hypothetical protein K502DRAFT_367616 [Neoconidiobolus thromboides FSU 785]|nr:hypothetical protein K502DRAFT_367616 [Neoconidiobolus thromboides FSU 785]